MKSYGELLKLALEQLKEVFPTIPENAKIAPFLNIHDNGDEKDTD